MEIRTLVSILIFVLAVLMITQSSMAGKKEYVATEDEEIYGIWINPDYNDMEPRAKFIAKQDTFETYHKTDSTHRNTWGECTITDKWTDSEGNIWYKYVDTLSFYAGIKRTTPRYCLAKIDKSGNILERVVSGIDYPAELGPDVLLYTYTIHYRQE